MASGFRRLKINTQERAVSTDINRLQSFHEQDQAELLRYMLDAYGNDDMDAGSLITEPVAVESPLRAEVINGLLVVPDLATLGVAVNAGVLCALVPDVLADESDYKYIRDAGSTGTLTMTANSSGSTRIDVVECRVNPVEATVNDNRDIFNATTGLFTATSVAKELKGQLEYRVRLGTPGGGFPGTASGWLPLAVASVPTATTTNDTITFWDVRPLLNDRAHGAFNLTRNVPLSSHDTQLSIDSSTTYPTNTLVRGFAESVTEQGRKVGGWMRRGTPGTDANYVDLKLAANQDGSAFAANSMAYLYLVTPFGLPRWARYADSPSVRQPRSPRGIPVLSSVTPQHMKASATANITLPAASGLNGVAVPGETTCIAALPVGSAGANDLYSSILEGRKQYLYSISPTANLLTIAAATLGATSSTWTLVQNTNFPTNARALYVKVQLVFSVPLTVIDTITDFVLYFGTANPGVPIGRVRGDDLVWPNFSGIAINFPYTFVGWVPMASLDHPILSTSGTRRLTATYSHTVGTAPSSGNVEVLGWEI